jgi:endogenous inhibitor of DNA gyrase (YacG/DUF329 family)
LDYQFGQNQRLRGGNFSPLFFQDSDPMTFDHLHPNPTDDILIDGDYVFRISDLDPARICTCGAETRWISISFEAPYCSPECLAKEWAGYWLAVKEKAD